MRYAKATLELGRGEQRARFINEFSEAERRAFAKALLRRYRKVGLGMADLKKDVPEAIPYVR